MKIILWMAVVLMGNVLMSLTYKEPLRADSKPASDTLVKGIEKIRTASPFTVGAAMKSQVAIKGIAGFSKLGRPIEAYYFPGTSTKKAMVIGGVHGSELSAIEVAKTLLSLLMEGEDHYYSVLVIPCLFPDNASQALNQPGAIGSVYNIGRYSHKEAADPNRQMPALGRAFTPDHPVDLAGRMIEPENQLLLNLIQEFRPQRIVNLHAIRVPDLGGIYADPRTNADGEALSYLSDSSLAIDIARHIQQGGGDVPGNHLETRPSSLYYCDPPVAEEGKVQKRNLAGSKLPGNRGYGVSLGSWASTAVRDNASPVNNRPAIRLLTIEFPGYKRPADYAKPSGQQKCAKLIRLYAGAIHDVFLQKNYEEDGNWE